jgi:DNA-binding XRE family transcriptional regulator
MLCPECKTEMVFGAHLIETSVGGHSVECRSISHERCPACGCYELSAEVGVLLEVQAAIIVMADVPAPSLKAIRFARKAMGLSQSALAVELGLTQETISRYETGVLAVLPEYRLALAGLLGREERRLRGCEGICSRLASTGTDG